MSKQKGCERVINDRILLKLIPDLLNCAKSANLVATFCGNFIFFYKTNDFIYVVSVGKVKYG